MKKIKLAAFIILTMVASLALTACAKETKTATQGSRTFKALNGEIKIPNNPQRVVVQNYPDEALALGVNVVGTDAWSYANPYLSSQQKSNLTDLGAPSLNLEALAALKPDLIISVDKTQVAADEKIAPTILVNYTELSGLDGSLNYFAKLLNKEKEKTEFLQSFDQEAARQKNKLKTEGKIDPSQKTISILELQGDKIYAYGDSFARGGQALTRGLDFKESSKMTELSKGSGYAEVNAESLADFDADYLFVDFSNADANQYQALKTNPVWQKLKAVKENHVITMDYNKVYFFGGPIASKSQLSLYTEAILKAK